MNIRTLVFITAVAFAGGCDGETVTIDGGQSTSDQGSASADVTTADAVVVGEDAAPDVPEVGVPDEGVVPDAGEPQSNFSFFVTSLEGMRKLSGSNDGFGGDFGGLAGADSICQRLAEAASGGGRTWRALLCATDDGNGNPVHGIERIGSGPWYDANGRMVASGIAGLLDDRPDGDAQTVNDLPNEFGIPLSSYGNAHDIVTGCGQDGRLRRPLLESTCNDWTSANGQIGGDRDNGVYGGHSYPRRPGQTRGAQWLSDHGLRGCGAGVNLIQNGAGTGTCIGCSGGYGALYCFAE